MHLEFWRPHFKKDVDSMEKVQRRARSSAPKVPAMSPSGYTLCLLLLVAAVWLWLPCCEGKDYPGFLRRHQDYPKSNYGNDKKYCNKMMPRKGLMCRRRNAFIHATEQQLRSICNPGGQIQNGITTSRAIFSITTCKRKKRCRYKGESKTRRIQVICKNGLPVRYISHL
ncbi:ribonuclease-like [Heteronotia binoei]|uniref:ribonuclease-like n=1 Tax=Heteronotia binoei TaxID=13085 RepID=UPI002930CE78|nr:ribonuclease-like [Heteronotia binoei]